MDYFISENYIIPNHYCKEKKFTSTSFISERNGLRHCYHLFKTENNIKRKGTAIFVHGYSSHTLAEYLNIVENTEFNKKKNNKIPLNISELNKSDLIKYDPWEDSKYIPSYNGSYIHYFNKKGYDVISLDLEGHGFSSGSRCNSEDLDNCCHNIIQMLKMETIKNLGKEKDYEKYGIYSYIWNNEIEKQNIQNEDYLEKYDKENGSNFFSDDKGIKTNFNIKKLKKCLYCNEYCNFKDTFGEKIVICGISMGGAIAFRLVELIGETVIEKKEVLSDKSFVKCLRSRLICTILLSPMLSLNSIKRKPINRILLPLLPITSYLFPNLQVGGRAYNPREDHIYVFSKCDPLYYSKRVKALMCKSLLNFTEIIDKNIHYYPLDIPLLICHCVHDSMTDFEGSERTINILNQLKIQSSESNYIENKSTSEFLLWPITCKKMWHVITREVGFQDLLERILDWISKKEIYHEKKHLSINNFRNNSSKQFLKSIRNRQIFKNNIIDVKS